MIRSVLGVCAGALLVIGCGASKPEAPPQTPAAQVPPTMTPGGIATTPGGEQFAVADEPSGGADRPKMNAAAQQAYMAGLQAFQAGDLKTAKDQFTRAGQADGNAYQAHYSLGVVQERLGNASGAMSAYKRAIAVVSDYEPAIFAYGVLLARSDKASEAEQYLEQKRAKMPKSAAVLAALAEVKSIQGDSGAAQRLAQEALKRNPDYRPAMVIMARDHYRNRRLDLSLYTLKGILDGFGPENPPRDPNNAEARMIRGLIYKEQGLRKPAVEELTKALDLRPDLVEARVHLAGYLLESGNAQAAAQLLEGAVRYDGDNVLARLNLGDAYRLLGRAGDAHKELEWVAKQEPSLAPVHYNLGLLYLFSENIPGVAPKQAADKAIGAFEQYQKLKPRGAGPDDTEELITRAKTKKALIEAKEAEQAAQPAPAAAAPPADGAGATDAVPPAGGAQ